MPNFAKDRALRTPGQLLHSLEAGKLPERLMVTQKEVVAELERLQGLGVRKPKGKITLTLDIEYEDGLIQIKPTVTKKTPTPPSKKTPLFVLEDGTLTTSNPAQDEFAFKDVSAPIGGAVLDVDPATGEILDASEA